MDKDDYYMTAQYLNEQRLVRRKFDLMLQAYSIVGVLVALFAVGYLVLTFLPFELSVQQQMASAFVGVGIALALTSRILILFRKEREAAELERLKEYEHIATFLEVWSQFETLSKEVLSRTDEDFNKHSLRSVISRLHEDGRINEADVMALGEALEIRNSIVHSGRPLPARLADEIMNVLGGIIRKIAVSI